MNCFIGLFPFLLKFLRFSSFFVSISSVLFNILPLLRNSKVLQPVGECSLKVVSWLEMTRRELCVCTLLDSIIKLQYEWLKLPISLHPYTQPGLKSATERALNICSQSKSYYAPVAFLLLLRRQLWLKLLNKSHVPCFFPYPLSDSPLCVHLSGSLSLAPSLLPFLSCPSLLPSLLLLLPGPSLLPLSASSLFYI